MKQRLNVDQVLQILDRALERTREGALKWSPWPSNPGEYEVRTGKFKYYVGPEISDEKYLHFQIFGPDPTGQHRFFEIQEVTTEDAHYSLPITELYKAAETAAREADPLPQEILDELG